MTPTPDCGNRGADLGPQAPACPGGAAPARPHLPGRAPPQPTQAPPCPSPNLGGGQSTRWGRRPPVRAERGVGGGGVYPVPAGPQGPCSLLGTAFLCLEGQWLDPMESPPGGKWGTRTVIRFRPLRAFGGVSGAPARAPAGAGAPCGLTRRSPRLGAPSPPRPRGPLASLWVSLAPGSEVRSPFWAPARPEAFPDHAPLAANSSPEQRDPFPP